MHLLDTADRFSKPLLSTAQGTRILFTDGKRHSVMAATRKEALEKAQDMIARRPRVSTAPRCRLRSRIF